MESTKNLQVERELLITNISSLLLSGKGGYREIKISRELYMDITMDEIIKMGEYVKNFISLVYDMEVPNFKFELGEKGLIMIIGKRKRGRVKIESEGTDNLSKRKSRSIRNQSKTM